MNTTQKQVKTTLEIAVKPQKNYGKIYNCSLPESDFKETPSQADGLDLETETDVQILDCELIQTAGILELPQVAMATVTGQIHLQRFYYSKWLVEDESCRIQDIINVFHHMKQERAQKPIIPLVDHNNIELKNQVINAERRVLKELGFCVHVKHPHKYLIVVHLQVLQCEKNSQLMQLTVNYTNDALRSDVYMRSPPNKIACACIYLAARKIGLPLPNNPHWFSLFRVTEEHIRNVSVNILQLYKRPLVNPEELEKRVENIKRVYQTNKQKLAMKERESTKAEEKKVEFSPPSIYKDTKRDYKKVMSPKTPSFSSKYHSSHKSKRERSRSPHEHSTRDSDTILVREGREMDLRKERSRLERATGISSTYWRPWEY